jgi:lipopolysaccharide transport system ATP-binding protein
MAAPAIQIERLGKRYTIGQQQPYRALRDTVTDAMYWPFKAAAGAVRGARGRNGHKPVREKIWALRDVSFDVAPGETIGIVGRNGAGKSTLLKILTRITEPTEGRALVRGRVASLLEVGTGFHPELTGRENVYLNGAILGMRRAEIKRKFDEIVEFSGVQKFLDTPVKRYSSGMSVRLAFAVAAHLEPEILLIDEVLAVGDAAFQKKCMGKMGSVAQDGRTVFLVSHNMEAITGLCRRAVWLDGGNVRADGEPERVIQEYLAATRGMGTGVSLAERKDRLGAGRLRFTDFEIRDSQGNPITFIHAGDAVDLVCSYEAHEPLRNVSVYVVVKDHLDHDMLCFWSKLTGEDFEILPERGELVCRIPEFPLLPGVYGINIGASVNSATVSDSGDEVKDAATIEVITGDFFGTGRTSPPTIRFQCRHSWRLEDRYG